MIRSALQDRGGNPTRAAEILGISREGFRTKLPRLQIPGDADLLASPLPKTDETNIFGTAGTPLANSHFFNPRRSSNAENLRSLRSGSAIGSVGR